MGEIAEDMVQGTCCHLCNTYFVHKDNTEVLYTHGYPVVCQDCWDHLDEYKEMYQLFDTENAVEL